MLETIPLKPQQSWQEILSDLVTDPEELFSLLQFKADETPIQDSILEKFPLRVPRPYLSRISLNNPQDPLLLQVLPQNAEAVITKGYSQDPLGEGQHNPVPGILHKYAGRVLLMPTSTCAVHCRYCFRQHFPYQENIPDKAQWQQSLEYLKQSTEVEEVILSGGDPLAISDRHLDWIITSLEDIPHLQRLRIHTRLPIMIPQRVTPELCLRLKNSSLTVSIVLHCNHAQEFDSDVDQACRLLHTAGLILLNQAVLLNGINHQPDSQIALSKRLFQSKVLPYYLHLLDKTQGTAHFDVHPDHAKTLIKTLKAALPGYLVPRLVQEQAGQNSKTHLY